MSAIQRFLTTLGDIFAAILKALGSDPPIAKPEAARAPAPVSQPAPKPADKPSLPSEVEAVTAEGLNAIEKVFGPLVDIVRGRGTVMDDEEAVNAALNVAAVLAPTFAPEIGIIEAAEPVALWFLGYLRSHATDAGPITPPKASPPLTQADWSKGFPQPQPVDNPSGAIGGGPVYPAFDE